MKPSLKPSKNPKIARGGPLLAEKSIQKLLLNRFKHAKEELLTTPDELKNIWILRRFLQGMNNEVEAIETLIDQLKVTKTNDALFTAMKR